MIEAVQDDSVAAPTTLKWMSRRTWMACHFCVLDIFLSYLKYIYYIMCCHPCIIYAVREGPLHSCVNPMYSYVLFSKTS